jgi:hypothetical protein
VTLIDIADLADGLGDLLPEARLAASRRKIHAPFELDETMRFYSPQTNLAALTHPRVAQWLDFVTGTWTPSPVDRTHARIGLLMPCCKYKPYVTSREHRAINAALLADGWRPVRGFDGPTDLLDVLAPGQSSDLLSVAPLVRDGVVLDRFVLSEPLALVPYEHSLYLPAALGGGPSPAVSYDDPGLFEARGTSVSPERSDFTATRRADGSWAWGPAERDAYVRIHNAMSGALAVALTRLGPAYDAFCGWVSMGLTHRSFLASADQRRAEGLPTSKVGLNGPMALIGLLDEVPGAVEVLPTGAWTTAAKADLAARLGREGRSTAARSVNAVFARGDGHDTPLGLPELTSRLAAHLGGIADRLGR